MSPVLPPLPAIKPALGSPSLSSNLSPPLPLLLFLLLLPLHPHPSHQVYSLTSHDLCLAGTAEVPIAGSFMDKVYSEEQLPLKVVAFSHCFRTEAGAAGQATR